MHPYDTNGNDPGWEWGPPQQRTQPVTQQLTLVLTRRLWAQLQAVAHDLEMTPDDAALHLLRESTWQRYHLMQHI